MLVKGATGCHMLSVTVSNDITANLRNQTIWLRHNIGRSCSGWLWWVQAYVVHTYSCAISFRYSYHCIGLVCMSAGNRTHCMSCIWKQWATSVASKEWWCRQHVWYKRYKIRLSSNVWYKMHLNRQYNYWSLRCSWSVACQRRSN